jgi:protein-ribulosamine 3-kinase
MISGVPFAITKELQTILKADLKNFSSISGGCINNGGKLETSIGNFFLKWNYQEKYPGMFHAESRGLEILAEAAVIHIPKVIIHGEADEWQFILLEFVEQAPKSNSYWKTLGTQLATLHKNSSSSFGLDHDNYIGSLEQKNTSQQDWINFFISERLEPQLKLAIGRKNVDRDLVHKFRQLYKKLPDLLPAKNLRCCTEIYGPEILSPIAKASLAL